MALDPEIIKAAADSGVAIAIIRTLRPAVRNLLGSPTKELGAAIGQYIKIRSCNILQKLDRQLSTEGEERLKSLPSQRVARVQRTIFQAAMSSGEEILDYWTKIIEGQILADSDEEVDLSESLVGALREMTDTHVRGLRSLGNFVRLKSDELFDEYRWSDYCQFTNDRCCDALYPLDMERQILLLEDLVRLRLVVEEKTNMSFRYRYLSRRAISLLQLGGWKPFEVFPWSRKVDFLIGNPDCRLMAAWATRRGAPFEAFELRFTNSVELYVLFDGSKYLIAGPDATYADTESPQLFSIVVGDRLKGTRRPYAAVAGLESISKALRTQPFPESIATLTAKSSLSHIRATRERSSDDLEKWRIEVFDLADSKRPIAVAPVDVSYHLFREMTDLLKTFYKVSD